MSAEQDIEAFLSGYPDEVHAVAKALRKTVRAIVKEHNETLHTGFSYGGKRRVCAIARAG